MSRRSLPPLVLREFQREAVDRIAFVLTDTAGKIRAVPARRHEIMRQIGCLLLETPTASGKTVMLAAAAERASTEQPVVWFWYAPFKGVVDQTVAALRRAAPGLRLRDPRLDRTAIGTRPGDVFVSTWAAVAARNAESRRMRMDDDMQPALDTLVRAVRDAGLLIGAVVDEAHHSFKPNSEAFRFLQNVLQPDLLMLASATPNDSDVKLLRKSMDIVRFQHIAISRERVVAARLNKQAIKAITFVVKGASQGLLDLNEVALRKAVEQHRALKQALHSAGIPMVPLLLVQAATSVWTPLRVKTLLLGRLGFPEGAVGVHTADEPDPDVQALAQDPNVEVLVFKMAVATGFDAPRASTLCALRPIQDPGFGLQVIGRIMRVHPLLQPRDDLPADLNTGYVFLGDAEGQTGLQTAADRVRAIRDAINIYSDSVTLYMATEGGGADITLEDELGQRVLALAAPLEDAATETQTTTSTGRAVPLYATPDTLFGQLADISASPPHPPEARPSEAGGGTNASSSAPRLPYSYPMRLGLPVPKRLLTEKMPQDMKVLVDTLVNSVIYTAEHRAMVRQFQTDVERRETDLFEATASRRSAEQAVISELFAQESAFRTLRVSDHIDPQDLTRRLLEKLRITIERAGEESPDQRVLRRGLNVILVRFPHICREALRRAMATCAEVVDAADLPKTWDSAVPLETSPLNLYGYRPSDLNKWEIAFADWLDRQSDLVIWWLRNQPQPRSNNAWAVRIVLPETGAGFFPDFVICVNGRKKPDGIALADTKERIAGLDAEAKSRTEHQAYGRALILTYDTVADRFIRVEFDPALGRNREGAMLEPRNLLSD